MQEKVRIFKSSWYYSRFLIRFSIRKKWSILCLRSPVLQSKQVVLTRSALDLLSLYRRLNPIKIWPTYAVPPTTTLYPRSTYDLWRAGSSPTNFQPVEKRIPLTTTSQSGPDQSPLYFRPTYALPDQDPLIADLSIFPERERAGVDRVSGVNGPLTDGIYSNVEHKPLKDGTRMAQCSKIDEVIKLCLPQPLRTLIKDLLFLNFLNVCPSQAA